MAAILLAKRAMKRKVLLLCALFLASLTALEAADPISFKEISMLLRNGEDQQFIINDTARRKLLHPLSPDEIQTLTSLQASPALLNLLRDPATLVSPDTATAYTKRVEQQKAQAQQEQQLAEQAAAAARQQQLQKLLAATPAPAPAPAPTASKEQHPEYLGKPLSLKFAAADGSPFDLEKLRGKVVLVDFWATWCGPCMQAMPHVLSAYQKYHDKGFEIVGISLDSDKNRMLKITAEKGMVWPQYFDGKRWSNDIVTKFGIREIPAMWLISKKGLIATTSAHENLEGTIQKLLAE